jgi:hypothetical protein
MSAANAKAIASFVRWRLKPVRWSAKLLGEVRFLPSRLLERPVTAHGGDEALVALDADGYAKVASGIEFPPIDIAGLAGRAAGKSFVDVGPDHPSVLADAFTSVMRRPGVQETVLRYFDGRPWLWNVALNYSDVSERMSDSQLWHFDYGDTRQLHFMAYFTDVGLDCGPFTFLDAGTSGKVPRHPLVVERFTDKALADAYGIDVAADAIRLVGSRGDVYAADPGRVMHQGARCARPRLVMFVTFTTPTPMSRGGRSTITRAQRDALWGALRRAGEPLLGERVFR